MWQFNNYLNHYAAITDSGDRITYRELSEISVRFQSVCQPRTLAFCLCRNDIGSLTGYVGLYESRVVSLLLDCSLNGDLFERLFKSYHPDYIWVPKEVAGALKLFEIKSAREVLVYDDYLLIKFDNFESGPIHNELALLMTTSGSTGSPNLVRQSYGNIESNTSSIVDYLNLDAAERPITTLPLHYTYGLSVVNSHLAVGATIMVTSSTLMQRSFWKFLEESGANSVSGVPYTYEMLKKLRFTGMNLPRLKTLTQAGGKLRPELHKEFAEYAEASSKRFVVMYGQTEATARMSYLPSGRSLEKCGSVGIAIPGGRFSLIDGSGHVIEKQGITGELVYEGPNVTLGYADSREDLAKGNENGFRLVTGDMAWRDKDGFYYIVGRKKRFIKIFGNRVNLDEVERLIQGAFSELDFACLGTDDRMVICVIDTSLAVPVRSFIAAKTRIPHSAIFLTCVGHIPKSSAGKTLYAELERVAL